MPEHRFLGGQVWFGAGTDEGLVPDPEELMVGFHAEFKALRRATRALAAGRDKNAAREGSIEAMNTMLDEALAKVDALLQDTEAETSRGLD